jgi:hypothetical protein
LALHQQAADELGGNDLGGAGEEGLGVVLGERGGYWNGFVSLCGLLLTTKQELFWAERRSLLEPQLTKK